MADAKTVKIVEAPIEHESRVELKPIPRADGALRESKTNEWTLYARGGLTASDMLRLEIWINFAEEMREGDQIDVFDAVSLGDSVMRDSSRPTEGGVPPKKRTNRQ
jgi:hypothetical protein